MMPYLFLSLSALMLSGCQEKNMSKEMDQKGLANSGALLGHLSRSLPQNASLARVVDLVKAGQLKKASMYMNGLLQASPQNPFLHLMNGFIYEEMAKSGEDSRKELVTIAYRTARELDPSNWLCCYFLGASQLREGKYQEAQQALADAALLNRHSAEVWYDLACASYYAADLIVASNAIDKASQIQSKNPQILRAKAMIFAACKDFKMAEEAHHAYGSIVGKSEEDVRVVKRRMDEWRTFYDQPEIRRVSVLGNFAEGVRGKGGAEREELRDTKKKKEHITIVFECCIMRTSLSYRTQKGNNIFDSVNPISITLGGDLGPSYNFNSTMQKSEQGGASTPWTGGDTRTFKFGIGTSAINYACNIMNAGENETEVLARPVLSTMLGKSAMFVEGEQYTGASAAQGLSSSTLTSVDAGTKIEIIPLEITDDGLIVMEINITGGFFTTPPDATRPASSQMFSINQSVLKTTCKARPGSTTMLGGMYLNSRVMKKSGFPGLQDIPLIQYFTSSSQTSSDSRCALFLITPRLGGSEHVAEESPSPIPSSEVAEKLVKSGLMAVNEKSAIYYIMKGISACALFPNLRSGDLPMPFFGLTTSSLKNKLDQLKTFLWF